MPDPRDIAEDSVIAIPLEEMRAILDRWRREADVSSVRASLAIAARRQADKMRGHWPEP